MKLLHRLREVWATHTAVESDNANTQTGVDDMDFDEYAFQQGMEDNAFYSIPSMSTLDGLRQRITGVHEDFPPGLMEQQGEHDGGS